MSDQRRNLSLFWIAVIGATISTVTVIMQVGELKGILQHTVSAHGAEITSLKQDIRTHDQAISDLRTGQRVIESRMHGLSSQIGKVPSKVAQAINPPED